MWRNEEVMWCTSSRELVPHKRQTHTKSMFSIVLGIARAQFNRDRVSLSVGLNAVYWLSGVGFAQAANTSAALKPLFFQRGPVIWKVGVNVALGLDVADVCC